MVLCLYIWITFHISHWIKWSVNQREIRLKCGLDTGPHCNIKLQSSLPGPPGVRLVTCLALLMDTKWKMSFKSYDTTSALDLLYVLSMNKPRSGDYMAAMMPTLQVPSGGNRSHPVSPSNTPVQLFRPINLFMLPGREYLLQQALMVIAGSSGNVASRTLTSLLTSDIAEGCHQWPFFKETSWRTPVLTKWLQSRWLQMPLCSG